MRSARKLLVPPETGLERLVAEIQACRLCREKPRGKPLPHEPRPVLRVSTTARIGVFGQAPGTRVHASGIPFTDPSGVRLRQWMGVSNDEFYDVSRIAVVPMGFCFPGQNATGGDLPPRSECAPLWRSRLMAALPNLELVILAGRYAINWHLEQGTARTLSNIVADWRAITQTTAAPQFWPLPHPSWHNNAWLNKNPWFDDELLPVLRARVRELLVRS